MKPVLRKAFVLIIIIFIISIVWVLVSSYIQEKEEREVSEDLSQMTLFELGQYYFNSDDDPAGPYDIQKAQSFYERAVEDNPINNESAWYQLGRTYFIQGEFDTALSKFSKQQEYFGNHIQGVYYMTGLTYAYKARITEDAEDWRNAEENFEKYIEYSTTSPWPRVDLAWIYFSQGKYEEMKSDLEEGLSYNPDNPWLLNMYGLALLNTEDPKKALSNFRDAYSQANLLTSEDWGKVYPGNNPNDWSRGIVEFKEVIQKNIDLLEQ